MVIVADEKRHHEFIHKMKYAAFRKLMEDKRVSFLSYESLDKQYTPELEQQLLQDFEASNHIATNGKEYPTLWAWKFNSLLFEYKQAHPFSNPS